MKTIHRNQKIQFSALAALLIAVTNSTAADKNPTAASPDAQGHVHDHAAMMSAHDHVHDHDLAPIGVMGEHVHAKGEWMASYRYMRMFMSGNRSGSDQLSVAQVNANFPIVPTEMTMEAHMFGAMYAPTDRLTIMLGVSYKRISMDHIAPGPGISFTTESVGLGDANLSTLTRLWSKGGHGFHANLGFSLPSGSIDETDFTPAGGPNSPLPYPMQLGSGTVDFKPGATYTGQTENWSWGAQVMGTARLGENSNDYTLGNEINGTGWFARRLCKWSSLSFRLNSKTWGNLDGADSRAGFPAAGFVPTADPNRRGGTRLDAMFGVNFLAPQDTKLKGHRLAIEGGLPVMQHLEGPQLETDWIITAGWQFAW
ncbi:MAG: hypothetical protein ACI8V5_004474 [Limisphaerales bacterium]|jgi:hypothetical protein